MAHGRGSILALNAGSSTLKFALFAQAPGLPVLERGELVDAAAIATLLDRADATTPGRVQAVGHRIVHGGADHVAPVRFTADVLKTLEDLTPLDPLHMPLCLEPARIVAAARPGLTQFACFDTAFHRTLPPVAQRFAIPRALFEAGVRRYGFHGLSCEYIAGQLRGQAPALAAGRVIIAHLGSGASLTALADGASIANSFGFGLLDGLMMATRCGAIDPGVVFHLGRQGHTLAEIEYMLTRRSGLLGVSGISGDLRVLLANDAAPACEAVELFVYRIALECGAMASALGGVNGIVFTGGIGEHAAGIRAMVCARLGWLGVRLDEGANAANALRIDGEGSTIDVRVIPTDEAAMIARHVLDLTGGDDLG